MKNRFLQKKNQKIYLIAMSLYSALSRLAKLIYGPQPFIIQMKLLVQLVGI
jgi:hypothetical protein